MPYEIDTEALDKAKVLDISKPPMRAIPHLEFPKCIYLHPKKPTRVVRVRDGKGNVVEEYKEATTFKAKTVNNQEELDAALKEGWRKEPYMPVAVPSRDEQIEYA